MFDDFTRYPKQRVGLFFRYLVNAAAKEERLSRRINLDTPRSQPAYVHHKEFQVTRLREVASDIELRTENLDSVRKDELETKILVYFSRNKYLPFEIRLKRIKERYDKMKKEKHPDKDKIARMKEKLRKCELLLTNIKLIEKKKALEKKEMERSLV
jgi:hypothetical protein